jgi:hypothetical protein
MHPGGSGILGEGREEKAMANTPASGRDPGVFGAPEPDEEHTDLLGGAEPGDDLLGGAEPQSDELGGPEPDSDELGGPEPDEEGTDLFGGPEPN